jgi:hypothetical protein
VREERVKKRSVAEREKELDKGTIGYWISSIN